MMRSLLLAFVVTFVCGCISNHTEHMQDVSPFGWSGGESVDLVYNNRDTTSQHKLSLLLRWDDTFTSRTLPCTITTTAPDSTIFTEDIVFEIKRGRILKHSTGYRDSEIDYRRGVKLSQMGDYKFVIAPTPGLVEPIVGVWATGINISK